MSPTHFYNQMQDLLPRPTWAFHPRTLMTFHVPAGKQGAIHPLLWDLPCFLLLSPCPSSSQRTRVAGGVLHESSCQPCSAFLPPQPPHAMCHLVIPEFCSARLRAAASSRPCFCLSVVTTYRSTFHTSDIMPDASSHTPSCFIWAMSLSVKHSLTREKKLRFHRSCNSLMAHT